METYSAFQQANPLSPKKFTKKIIGPVIAWVVMFIVLFTLKELASNSLSQEAVTSDISGLFSKVFYGYFVVFLPILIINILYQRAYIKRYYYDAGENFITIKKGVFAPTEIHVQYGKIQDVYVDQDLMDRVLGIFDVHIASATVTSGIEAHIDGVDKETAERIKNFFLNKITSGSTQQASQSTQSIPQNSSSPTITLDREVSSSTYPFSPTYKIISLVSSVFTSLIFSLVFLPGIKYAVSWIFVGFLLLLAIGSVMRQIIWMKNYFFSFEKDMIITKTKVISSEEKHLPYHTIQDVTLNQTLLDRVFGLASVTIQNASTSINGIGQNMYIPGQSVSKAKEIVEIVRGIMSKTQAGRTGL